ncbi:stage 0 sporulation regulatory protein [Virgibacillus halotolerans]|uniref:aspartyl-phosphate phosphatase Spo0E family protein n=1 Tax=Virgibacillus halotolerans TaxID=1071053 RepID=UPI001960F865|nr:aspartyl-phosphate phosphatase Spo0E family protein [Virgibacillus halotolerans]MBM7598763.1 stage 0 sporulation regulatory protein [Virgibacillus halotolerans]
MYANDELLVRIESQRNKMTEVALDKGFTSAESIAISQELDRLLNLYEKAKESRKI